jgi:hypothetical protein
MQDTTDDDLLAPQLKCRCLGSSQLLYLSFWIGFSGLSVV